MNVLRKGQEAEKRQMNISSMEFWHIVIRSFPEVIKNLFALDLYCNDIATIYIASHAFCLRM